MKSFVNVGIRGEKGAALLLAIILVLVAGLIAAPLLAHMGTGLLTGEVYETRTAELYAADAGVEDAVRRIQSGNVNLTQCDSTYGPYSVTDVNERNVTVTITLTSNTSGRLYKITSVAPTPSSNGSTKLESFLKFTPGTDLNIFSGALASQTSITLAKDSTVYGDVYYCSGTNISPRDISGNWTYQGCGQFPSQSENEAFANTFKALAMPPAGTTYPSGYTITRDGPFGPAYVIGDLKIATNNVVLNGTIYVTGNIDADKDLVVTGRGSIIAHGLINFKMELTYNVTGDSLIMSLYGGIDINKSPGINALLYAPNGLIDFKKEAVVTGGVVAKTIEADKAGSITYVPKTSWDFPGGLPGSYRITSYQVNPG